ncbi:secreted PhoX family phosphatase [Chitinivorax tropicus]|uniref:Secreted PhoX family phosphatase n=1 Tax=Chitinivorax tropicus TaxID=714531 RepID=A0A840MNK6_9PROT|nr:alkaline phosphatase PhoX [Chitinivorax tropicus]MBB5017753.1 secreted PhoX family phosphatase [Chitinivorax tropicus]
MTNDTPPPEAPNRRQWLRTSLLASGLLALGGKAALANNLFAVPANPRGDEGLKPIMATGRLGPLQPPNSDGIRLPAGFTSRVVARSGSRVAGSGYIWHLEPDGGATFATHDGGWIYVSNAEVKDNKGGVGAIRFDRRGNIISAYSICTNTTRNCAGGPTPWGTWLTCEETDRGRVIECDPYGTRAPIVRNALGWFDHEAVAVDTRTGYLYLTEDKTDGRLYRFRPATPGNLTNGTLEVAKRIGNAAPYQLEWLPVPQPNPGGNDIRTRRQVPASSAFNGGEGIWFHNGVIYFTTKGDNRVWALTTGSNKLDIIYDEATAPNPILTGVDNVVVSRRGDVLVAEDGGDMQIVVIAPDRRVAPLLQVVNQDSSEITGPAFSPDGTRLYFSSQEATPAGGITYEISGPFQNL